jgi:hypothetical protein
MEWVKVGHERFLCASWLINELLMTLSYLNAVSILLSVGKIPINTQFNENNRKSSSDDLDEKQAFRSSQTVVRVLIR